MSTPPKGYIPITQAAPSMGLDVASAMAHAVVIDGQTLVPEQTMREVAAIRHKLALEEHKKIAEGSIEAHERKY